MNDKKSMSDEMKSFYVEESMKNTISVQSKKDWRNHIDFIVKALKNGESVTVVIQGKAVSISEKNGHVNIIDR